MPGSVKQSDKRASSWTQNVVFISVILYFASMRFTIERSKTKPHSTFEAFYPYYLEQHSNEVCKQLHYIGTSFFFLFALSDMNVLKSLLPAGAIGMACMNIFAGLEHGLFEMAAMVVTFLGYMYAKRGTSGLYKALSALVIAYGFAWVGHFYYELNKPATFIYPIYSLLGDFRMHYEMTKDFVMGLLQSS
jgi:hypothetical protein